MQPARYDCGERKAMSCPSLMEHLDDIRATLTHSRLCHEGWRIIEFPHPERDKIVNVYNRYAGFLDPVSPALFTTFVVKLCSLFGERSDEISLKLIPDVEQDPAFANIWKRGRQFYKYRNKFIAHRDRVQVLEGFQNPHGLNYDGLHQLLDDTCSLYDAAAKRLGFRGVHPLSCESDLMDLIQNLHRQMSV